PVAKKEETQAASPSATEKKYKHSMVQLFYDTMIEQEVRPDVAAHILRELENVDEDGQVDVRLLVKAVYGSIVDILKGPTLIDTNKGQAQTIVFMGPTGVGKTTTIAKLSSILTLKHGLRVGLITADTYRIAAVEQLKTYADILGLDIRVVYNPDEMEEHLIAMRARNDIVLIDTAGRSHKNAESIAELKILLDAVPESTRYLVVSVTTRYTDLCKIVSVFDQQTDFNLIFTKLDEAETLGSLMNICCLAGKKAAYVTFGQNVPDDLEAIKPDKIAKSLLGLADNGTHPYAEGGDTA
ncbi:MAG: flagellar biosynthesis protein FlhF, partial [Defluviitaleaceae bacterium]|nr:flagellar biosynthesis protein FlhF [Defluviitaleaceae bacterium]